jgi:DNA-binding NtrC family response regulator
LELDWRIEHLRASLERRRGHRDEARRLLHRALHTRDLIASFLPTRLRRRFLAQDRFRCLRDLEARLATVSPTPLRGGRRDELSQLGLVAHSQSMRAVCETVLRLRDQEIPVLITGETGAGKEVLARAIHRLSPRRNDRFQPLFLASVPVELFEAEVFGHEAGAFTGAEESRPGLLEHLAGGTLFLDEVSALAQEVQAKLLRAIESGAVRRVGALEARPIDVRFLAATSADLDAEVEKGAFRRDLYYRLAAVHIRVPPLRERREDIPELIAQLVEAHSRRLGVPAVSLPPASFDALVAHDWPGNVRQLESVIVRMLVGRAKPEDVGSYLDVARGGEAAPAARQLFDAGLLRGRSLTELHRELDREYLAMLFQRTRGDLHAMASTLEIKLANLYHWLRRVGLDIRVLRRGLRTRK